MSAKSRPVKASKKQASSKKLEKKQELNTVSMLRRFFDR